MDVVALASVISSATVGLTGAGVAFYNTRRTAKTTQQGRAEQRSADGHLKVLGLAEQEAQWHDSCVHNLSLDPQQIVWGVVERIDDAPKPAVTDRALAASVIAAFASEPVRVSHAAWREAADALAEIKWISLGMVVHGDVREGAPDEWIKELTEDLQPKEQAARQALAEAVARELGHR